MRIENRYLRAFCLLILLFVSSIAYSNHGGLFFHSAMKWPTTKPDLGNLIISSSQTVNIAGGQTYIYHSITIQSGGTLTVNPGNNSQPTILGVKTLFINDGTVNANNSTYTGLVSATAPDSTLISYTVSQASGGSGGAGGNGDANTGYPNYAGGSGGGQCNGNGGGGGAGSHSRYGQGGNGGDGCSNGGSAIGRAAGYGSGPGGIGNTGYGGDASVVTGGQGGGGGGGAGLSGTFSTGAAGGGGARGNQGQVLFISSRSIAGAGVFNLNGSSGGNGGNGATGAWDGGGGGGTGGGGAGGSGGYLFVKATVANTFSGSVNVSPGSGGIAGQSPGAAVYYCPSVCNWGRVGNIGTTGASGSAGTYLFK